MGYEILSASTAGKTVILVTNDRLGSVGPEDSEFGEEMLDNFFHALESRNDRPDTICFYTQGVRALATGSPFAAGLQLLQGLGVRILACGSCVEHYGLTGNLAAGEIAGMPDIVECIAQAAKVVTI